MRSTAAQTRSGFSLVELMVVVAIIGVLAAIAVPNYRRFQMRAKQGEAKTALASAYTALKTWHIEHDNYTHSLHQAGYEPEGSLKHYNVGFDGTPGVNYYVCSGPSCKMLSTDMPTGNALPSPNFYILAADGNLDDDPSLDNWRLWHTRVLDHSNPD